MSKLATVLILSGIDPTNGAGLGRDILTVRENNCFPISVPTALTVQNSMNFQSLKAVDINYIRNSVDLLKNEFSIKAVKVGLLPTDEKWLAKFSKILSELSVPIVIDTVLKATSDKNKDDIPTSYLELISGKNKIITPNLKELKNIHKLIFNSEDSPEKMAKNISKRTKSSVLTTFEGTKNQINITTETQIKKIEIKLLNPQNSYHGTGCTFSSALAANLANENSLTAATKKASLYTFQKISNSFKFSDKGQFFLT